MSEIRVTRNVALDSGAVLQPGKTYPEKDIPAGRLAILKDLGLAYVVEPEPKKRAIKAKKVEEKKTSDPKKDPKPKTKKVEEQAAPDPKDPEIDLDPKTETDPSEDLEGLD